MSVSRPAFTMLWSADLNSDVIKFGDVGLKQVFLQISLEAKGNEKKNDQIIGEVTFSTLAFDRAAHLYKSLIPVPRMDHARCVNGQRSFSGPFKGCAKNWRITTGLFELALVAKHTKELILSARLEIPVAHFRTAEIHTLPDANMPNVEPTGQTTGWWENLLGIGSKVKVGPNLWLSISIIYA